MRSLLNWKACKDFALGYARKSRPGANFNRVSKKVQFHLEMVMRDTIAKTVDKHSSGSRTIKDT